MNKSILTAAIAIPLVVGGLIAIGATHRASDAPAHIPDHSVECERITASGTKYTQGGTVDLTIGAAHAHHVFAGPTFSYTLTNPDRTQDERWSIVIVSNAGDGNATYEGTIRQCASTSTTTPTASSTTTTAVPASTTTKPQDPPFVTTTTAVPATTATSSPTSSLPAPPPSSTSPSPSVPASTAPSTSSTTSTPDAVPPARHTTASTLPETL